MHVDSLHCFPLNGADTMSSGRTVSERFGMEGNGICFVYERQPDRSAHAIGTSSPLYPRLFGIQAGLGSRKISLYEPDEGFFEIPLPRFGDEIELHTDGGEPQTYFDLELEDGVVQMLANTLDTNQVGIASRPSPLWYRREKTDPLSRPEDSVIQVVFLETLQVVKDALGLVESTDDFARRFRPHIVVSGAQPFAELNARKLTLKGSVDALFPETAALDVVGRVERDHVPGGSVNEFSGEVLGRFSLSQLTDVLVHLSGQNTLGLNTVLSNGYGERHIGSNQQVEVEFTPTEDA